MDEEQFDLQLSQLLECFPQVEFEILSEAVLESNGSSLDAVDYVLARIMDDDLIEESSLELSPLTKELAKLFPSVNVQVLEAFVAASFPEDDLEVLSNELMLHLGTSAALQNKKKKWKRLEPVNFGLPNRGQAFQAKSISPSRTTKDLVNKIALYLRESLGVEGALKDDPQELREEAQELQSQRSTILDRASEAHRRGGLTGKSSAQYYASEAHNLTRHIDACHRKAAYITFCNFNLEFDRDEIDLHGLTVLEAMPIVEMIVEAVTLPGWTVPCLKIIAGAGRHSVAGPRLRPAIWQKLRELNVHFSYDGQAAFALSKM